MTREGAKTKARKAPAKQKRSAPVKRNTTKREPLLPLTDPASVVLPDAVTIVERLASLYCSDLEICYVLGIDLRVLYRSFLGHGLDGGQGWADLSIRRVQFRNAMNGDTTMLEWLGRQFLGQTENGPREMTREEKRVARNAKMPGEDDERKRKGPVN